MPRLHARDFAGFSDEEAQRLLKNGRDRAFFPFFGCFRADPGASARSRAGFQGGQSAAGPVREAF